MTTLVAELASNSASRRAEHVSETAEIRRLLCLELDWIPSADFDAFDDECDKGLIESTLRGEKSQAKVPADLPAHLRRLCEEELLTQQQETALFRGMNYAKYRANLLRSELDADQDDPSVIEEIKSLVVRAQSIRDHIIKANMRLVMSVVKKFVTPQHSFDDMLSEGAFTLMQAVEKFDYSRGFRFSTYAYRSIARSAYRSVTSARKEEALMTRDAEDWAFEHVDDRSSSPSSERVWSKLREATASMLDRLDRRERFIVRSRYALGSHRKVKTFQYLADKLGVSKERVRQLEQRAVSKLQGMAEELETEEIFGAAMA